jgi:hypothetical protein
MSTKLTLNIQISLKTGNSGELSEWSHRIGSECGQSHSIGKVTTHISRPELKTYDLKSLLKMKLDGIWENRKLWVALRIFSVAIKNITPVQQKDMNITCAKKLPTDNIFA